MLADYHANSMNMRFCLLLLVAAALSACPSPNISPMSRDKAAKASILRADQARLYVLRKSTFIAGGVMIPVVLNSQVVGQVAVGTYLMLELKPGHYILSSTLEGNNKEYEVDAAGGHSYFIEQKIGWLPGGAYYDPVSDSEGRSAVQKLKRVQEHFTQ